MDRRMKMKRGSLGKKNKYITGIDGLRALAVLMVLSYHLKLPFAKGGLLGVTVFFVISGFLITRILILDIENTYTIDLKTFWLRRIRRLLPAVLTMVTVLIFATAVFNRVLFTKACPDLLSVIFGYNNWWQILNQVSYFENAGAPSPLTHCWSLAIEAQFYLLYPLLLMFLARFRESRKWSARVTFVLALISMGLMWLMFDPAKDPSRVYYGTDTRAFSLLFGAFLALSEDSERFSERMSPALCDVVGGISLAGLLYMMIAIDGYSSFLYKGGQGLASVLTMVVVFTITNKEGMLSRILSVYPLKWVGDRSYGIYLWHYPVILLVSNGEKSTWWMTIIEVLITVLLTELSYEFIETPIRHGVIGKNIAFLRKRPANKRERMKQLRLLKRCMKLGGAVFVVGVSVILCVAFVPRENALDNIEELEKQALDASKIADKKASETVTSTDERKDEEVQRENLSDEELLESLKLLLIGDSIALGAADEFYDVFPNSICDAAVSRYTTESYAIYDSYVNEKGWNGDGVIFALGSNGLLYDSLGTLKGKVGADRPFFVITSRAPHVNWEESNNREIYEFSESTENTYLVDWYKFSEGHSEYFVEDGTHLSDEGAKAYINCIEEAVLAAYRK